MYLIASGVGAIDVSILCGETDVSLRIYHPVGSWIRRCYPHAALRCVYLWILDMYVVQLAVYIHLHCVSHHQQLISTPRVAPPADPVP